MKLLSIIIPCYNCSKTIERLLDSILDNKLEKDEYEVIICDDKSTDNFLELVKPYEEIMNVIYCTTTREVHCPGNTRQAALSYITGKWFCFIDNDDMFEPDAFKNIFKYIEENNVEYILCTNMREYFYEEQRYGREFIGDETDTWLHGKIFNTQKILKEAKSYFKEDLLSHEDLFFNSNNLAYLISIGKDYTYYPIFTYKWIHNPESLSRSYFNKTHYYIDTYLGDYLTSSSYPFFDMYKNSENKDFALNQILMTLLHGYFYYQASLWRLGPNDTLEKSYNDLRSLKRKIVKEIGLTDFDIINYIHAVPERYASIRAKSIIGTCPFVEVQSFRDFIINL